MAILNLSVPLSFSLDSHFLYTPVHLPSPPHPHLHRAFLSLPRPLPSCKTAASLTLRHGSQNTAFLSLKPRRKLPMRCEAGEYVFPDPIPEFAQAETEKFRDHLLKKLSEDQDDIFGEYYEEVVNVCTEIMSTFLHKEYQGPGTLLVIPFIDMADTVKERALPGGPEAARAAVVWAQEHVDKDWNKWTGSD